MNALRRIPDEGAGTVLVLLVTAVAGLAAMWFVALSSVSGERARAGNAADLAALAGAAAHSARGPSAACVAAAQVATANEVTVLTCTVDPESGVVTVSVAVRGRGLLSRFPPALGRARAGPATDP